jgi:hypothetical protein
MTSQRCLLLAILLAQAAPSDAGGQTFTGSEFNAPDAATKAAAESIQIFKQLVTPDTLPSYAFQSPGSVEKATVGAPMRDALIRLDSLANWDGKNVEALLTPTGRLIYPIITDATTHSSVTLALKDGRWSSVSFGPTEEAQTRQNINIDIRSKSAPGGPPIQTMQVRIPALNLAFVATYNNNAVTFTSMQSVPDMQLKVGEEEPASNVLARIQPFAKKLDPNRPN